MTVLRRYAVPPAALAFALAACGPRSGTAPPDDVVSDPVQLADGPPQTDGGAADASDGGAGDYYLPAGYTLTPFLSTEPQRMFSAAGQGTEPGRDYLAVLETGAGRIVLDLFEQQTPITVNSFAWLARHHYFDGVAFHRVIDRFVAQGGDPNSVDGAPSTWGRGGPGYMFGLEVLPDLRYDRAGVVGMARAADPNSNGSQFFITLAATPNLDGMYTIFARVTEGLDVLPQIVRGQPPANPTRMTRVYIVERMR